jgi:starch-binding outer membrane protein, SusD/RagB family
MKIKIFYIILLLSVFYLPGCYDEFLTIQPLDKITGDQLLSQEEGIRTLLATMYNRMPVEDFLYNAQGGSAFNTRGDDGSKGWGTVFYTDDAHRGFDAGVNSTSGFWDYQGIRQVNLFFENIKVATIPEHLYNSLKSEAHFIRAYFYFALARRYGGVPIITEVLEYIPGTANQQLFIPRSTEKEVWQFIINELDLATEYLPATRTSFDGFYRATKWSAYGLKSRAALHAASLAKYWDRAPLVGEAVTLNLVGGMTPADADYFYEQAIIASKEIIDNSGKQLYRPTPDNVAQARANFQDIFMYSKPNNEIGNEMLFTKGFYGTYGHHYDQWYSPSQAHPGHWSWGRFHPTLNLIDEFEVYSNDGVRGTSPIATRTDGNENYSVPNPIGLNVNQPYIKYNSPEEPFANRDARLGATVLFPGSLFKGNKIIIQGGLIRSDGSTLVYTDDQAVGLDGQTYYVYGSSSIIGHSGFMGMGQNDDASFTSSGFSVRKYLQEFETPLASLHTTTTDFIDIRLAEVYLNYAEAVLESGKGDANLAHSLVNALRRRAAHLDQIPLTLENVMKERRVELALEGQRYWDLIRRREYHLMFDGTRRKALVPMVDLRENPVKYIFVRADNYYDHNAGGRTWNPRNYYLGIPGTETNLLIQNPQY